MLNNKDNERQDCIPKLERLEQFRSWMFLIMSYLAGKDLSTVIQDNFARPTFAHPSLEAAGQGVPILPPVGQIQAAMIPADALGHPGQPGQEAGMTFAAFDTLLGIYFTMQSKVYGILMQAIQHFVPLYDHVLEVPEVTAMQTNRLLGSRIWTIIRNFCTENTSDALAGVIAAQILTLRLNQFSSCANLIREFNERYHVLPARLAHSDAQKKLQLQVACGQTYKQFIMIAASTQTYHELCRSLITMELTEDAANALSGLKSERGVLKFKAAEESTSETAMATVEENTQSNRVSTIGLRYQPRFETRRTNNGKYFNRSRSRSPSDSGKHGRSSSPSSYPSNRRRDYSRSPSPYREDTRSPGRDRRVIRYADINSQWRTGGSGYRDSRSPSRTAGTKRVYGPADIICYSCGAAGHKSNNCPQTNSSAAPPGNFNCFNCGRQGHKAAHCQATPRNNR
jgi:hypothetical protein